MQPEAPQFGVQFCALPESGHLGPYKGQLLPTGNGEAP